MAQLETGFYSNMQAPDIAQSFERGIRIGDMMKERRAKDLEMQKRQQMDAAMKAGVVTNPDGTKSFNEAISIGEMMSVDPMAANKLKQDFQQQQAANAETQSKIQSYVANSKFGDLEHLVKNPNDPNAPKIWKSVYDFGKSAGMDMAGYSDIYDPRVVNAAYNLAIPAVKKREFEMQQQQNEARLAETKQNNDFRREELGLRRLERKDALAVKNEEKQMALTTPYGLANTPDDAKIIKEAHEAKMSLFSQVDEMIKLRQKYEGGAIMQPDDQGYATQLSNDALLAYKNLKKLGVLSKSDEDIVNAIIPKDPLRLRGMAEVISGQDAVLSKLVNFRDNKSKDFASGIQARIRGGDVAAKKVLEEDKQSAPKTNQQDGAVRMRDPKGNIRLVSPENVEAAKAAGGVEL